MRKSRFTDSQIVAVLKVSLKSTNHSGRLSTLRHNAHSGGATIPASTFRLRSLHERSPFATVNPMQLCSAATARP